MATKPFKWADVGGTQFQTNSPTDSQYNGRPQATAAPAPAAQSAAAQVLTGEATALESGGIDPATGFEMFRKRKTTGGGMSAAAAMLGA